MFLILFCIAFCMTEVVLLIKSIKLKKKNSKILHIFNFLISILLMLIIYIR